MEDISPTECQAAYQRYVRTNFHGNLLCEPYPSHHYSLTKR